MNKSEVCVVIPIYKETLNVFEVQSVFQCFSVLLDYTIHFVCPKGLNVDFYKENFSEIKNYTFFDSSFFKDLAGYNRLMLSVDFYKAFDKYCYMLIYQTDCYVFKDELLDWANKGYDYIGGVWFERYHGNPDLGAKLWYPGNGGFSLRNVNKMIRILSSRLPLKTLKQIVEEKQLNLKEERKGFLRSFIEIPLMVLGYKNSFNYFAKKNVANEDVFFMEASLTYRKLNVPVVEEAVGFSWDRSPAFLFNAIGQLPFGCHAWYREDHCYEGNKEFWLKYIDNK
jgi:hypothetical protein